MSYKASFILQLSKVKGSLSARELQYWCKFHDVQETIWRNAFMGTAGTAFKEDFFTSGELERFKAKVHKDGWQVRSEMYEGAPAYLVSVPGEPISRQLTEEEIEEARTANVYIREAVQNSKRRH